MLVDVDVPALVVSLLLKRRKREALLCVDKSLKLLAEIVCLLCACTKRVKLLLDFSSLNVAHAHLGLEHVELVLVELVGVREFGLCCRQCYS